MSYQERARKAVTAGLKQESVWLHIEPLYESVAAALAEVRRETIEECLWKAEKYCKYGCRETESQISALQTQPATREVEK